MRFAVWSPMASLTPATAVRFTRNPLARHFLERTPRSARVRFSPALLREGNQHRHARLHRLHVFVAAEARAREHPSWINGVNELTSRRHYIPTSILGPRSSTRPQCSLEASYTIVWRIKRRCPRFSTPSGSRRSTREIDECKHRADKAEAMASYARQSGDIEMRKMADRIQARALDRCGELMRQIPAGQGRRSDLIPPGEVSLSDREQARIAAGLSKKQAANALSINNIPRDEFEAAVESENPPTAKALAEKGRKKRKRPLLDLGGRTPMEFKAATELIGIMPPQTAFDCSASPCR